jgi:putative phosphoesterase
MSTIAILSDTHDQIANLRAAVRYCNNEHINLLIHCGDLISPFMLKELAAFKGQTHLIYGNNAGDQHLTSSRCQKTFTSITHHGVLGDINYCGLRIGFVHYPEFAYGLTLQSTYDVVCCGHNHKHSVEWTDDTLLINPGHMLGEDDQAGFTLFDCRNMSTRRIRVGECMFNREVRVVPESTLLPSQETHNR